MYIEKYEFNSKEQFKNKLASLFSTDDDGNKIQEIKHELVELGYSIITPTTYNNEGEILTEAVLGDKYKADFIWHDIEDHPYGFKSYAIDLEDEGSHHFISGRKKLSYLSNRFKKD